MTKPISVPLFDLRAQYESIREEIDEAIQRVVESQHFILGPEVQALEQEIARYCEVRFAISCASGSDAILLALMALGVGPGDEVICPSYTFFATAGAGIETRGEACVRGHRSSDVQPRLRGGAPGSCALHAP